MASSSSSSDESSSSRGSSASPTNVTSLAIERLNDASRKAVEVVNKFANIEPPRDDEIDSKEHEGNPWKDPKRIEHELNVVRNELNDAWIELKKQRDDIIKNSDRYVDDFDDDDKVRIENINNEDEEEKKQDYDDDDIGKQGDDDNELSEEQFRVLYMDMITEAFGDSLNAMKEESEANGEESMIDVDILVDCLQSGIDLLDPLEEKNRKSYFDSLDYQYDDDNMMKDDDEENEDEGLTIHQQRQKSLGYLVQP